MTWLVKFADTADVDFAKLDKSIQKRIIKYLDERLTNCENPRLWGKPLTGSHGEKWRYRVGDYRILCVIKENVITVEVVSIGHRKEVYK
jgi:mRNA interferase RelE/StbE